MSHEGIVSEVQDVQMEGMGWANGEWRKEGKVSVRIIVAVVNHDTFGPQPLPLPPTPGTDHYTSTYALPGSLLPGRRILLVTNNLIWLWGCVPVTRQFEHGSFPVMGRRRD
jgi:hypothetical protein